MAIPLACLQIEGMKVLMSFFMHPVPDFRVSQKIPLLIKLAPAGLMASRRLVRNWIRHES
ncbi:hypothetical protein AA100600_1860 [Gluconobacter thailandicus F149-1 = NBRC 100600]|nr:hypothetical protein AA100600_1860 [Gluconobacter thailandicus F149-1 = NBRC 100600]